MSVGVALSALDGVVVFADGRTSHVVDDEAQSDRAVKLVAAPHDLPFVVVLIGRSSINGVVAANLVKRGCTTSRTTTCGPWILRLSQSAWSRFSRLRMRHPRRRAWARGAST